MEFDREDIAIRGEELIDFLESLCWIQRSWQISNVKIGAKREILSFNEMADLEILIFELCVVESFKSILS